MVRSHFITLLSKGKPNRFFMEFPSAKNVFALADLVD